MRSKSRTSLSTAFAACTNRNLNLRYIVSSSVRVRSERFGLLFYDTRSARLSYVASGESLVPLAFDAHGERELAVVRADAPQEQVIAQLLRKLQAKGLIVAVERAEY